MRSLLAPLLVIGGLMFHEAGLIGRLTLDTAFCAAVVLILGGALRRTGTALRRAAGIAAALGVASLAAALLLPGVALTPYLAVALINGLVALIFARGLLPGRTSIITQMIRVTGLGPEGSTAFQRYAQGQCWIWTVLAAVTMVLGLGAMLLPGWRAPLAEAIALMIGFQIAWFIGTHAYAQSRYNRPESCLDTLRAMANPNAWSKLEL